MSNFGDCKVTVSGKKREIYVIDEFNHYMGRVDNFDQMIFIPLKKKI